MIGAALLWIAAQASVELPAERTATRAEAIAGIAKGTAYLLDSQEENGAFGHWRHPDTEFWTNIGTHYAWQEATTGLAVIALLDILERDAIPASIPRARIVSALERGVDHLTEHAAVKRPSDWDTDNVWAYTYGLAALTRAAGWSGFALQAHAERRAGIRKTGEQLLQLLNSYQTPSGGWAYYADETLARRPAWATSFVTAAVVMGMFDAIELGWKVDEKRLARGIEAIKRCKLPNGAYTYSVQLFPSPGQLDNIDQIKGSLARIQVCNLALCRANDFEFNTGVSRYTLESGLGHFFKDHRFLDVARRKPIPHEAYYYNSGYFYFFGHYYAASVIERLPKKQRGKWIPRLWYEILKTQSGDGSMWDYWMHEYHKPYAVAYGVSALVRTL